MRRYVSNIFNGVYIYRFLFNVGLTIAVLRNSGTHIDEVLTEVDESKLWDRYRNQVQFACLCRWLCYDAKNRWRKIKSKTAILWNEEVYRSTTGRNWWIEKLNPHERHVYGRLDWKIDWCSGDHLQLRGGVWCDPKNVLCKHQTFTSAICMYTKINF